MSNFEPVLMVWDYYDGPRTGISEYKGVPHYFCCLWDKQTSNYSEKFELMEIEHLFLKAAKTNWKTFREWELKFHSGQVQHESHPGHRGNNPEYDRIEDELTEKIKQLEKLPDLFKPNFRPSANQIKAPMGVMAEFEASWLKIE